jgi:hypothetical protein
MGLLPQILLLTSCKAPDSSEFKAGTEKQGKTQRVFLLTITRCAQHTEGLISGWVVYIMPLRKLSWFAEEWAGVANAGGQGGRERHSWGGGGMKFYRNRVYLQQHPVRKPITCRRQSYITQTDLTSAM